MEKQIVHLCQILNRARKASEESKEALALKDQIVDDMRLLLDDGRLVIHPAVHATLLSLMGLTVETSSHTRFTIPLSSIPDLRDCLNRHFPSEDDVLYREVTQAT